MTVSLWILFGGVAAFATIVVPIEMVGRRQDRKATRR